MKSELYISLIKELFFLNTELDENDYHRFGRLPLNRE
jgi:hypothetical protein